LEKEINIFRVDSLHWQEFYARHINDLDLYVKIYCENFISEFDSILQAQEFDSLFIYNVSEASINKITEILNCSKEDIKNIKLTPKGLSNFITTFDVNGQKYILRFPGTDSDVIFERKKEVITQKYAHLHGIDNVLVYIDESGIKISKFVENCEDIFSNYYNDMDLMLKLVDKVTKLHSVSLLPEEKEILHFEPLNEADKLLDSATLIKQDAKSMFSALRESVHSLYIYLEKDGYAPVLCHNDINPYNILVSKTTFELIDYEFSGYCDPAYDFGRIIDGYDFKDAKIDILLERYFGRKPSKKDRMHWIGYIAIHAWYYFCWSLYKESIGLDAIHWMHYFYNRIKSVIKFVMPYYNGSC
jgi:thiamine kinase-like enzyme